MAETQAGGTGYANGRARRTQILDAAARLFIAGGSRGVSLREVAAAAGISHPGLLRHFRSTGEILLALLERYEEANTVWLEGAPLLLGSRAAVPELAAHNAELPGYVELFTSVAGEATSPAHPAHSYFRARYSDLIQRLGADRHVGLVILAGWDGLQLQSLYEPDQIDVPGLLRQRLGFPSPDGATLPSLRIAAAGRPLPELDDEPAGYQSGRETRRAIVSGAAELFSRGGFHATSVAKVAAHAGVSKSTLLHHFPSKDDLLVAVLQSREALRQKSLAEALTQPARERLLGLIRFAADEQSDPELLRLYCVLLGECASPRHPGHPYFRHRFASSRQIAIDAFAELITEGAISGDRDAALEGTWLVAWLNGIQFQWLYHPDSVDIADIAHHYLAELGID